MADADWTGIDVLVVDCPPGTGDEPLSVAQLLAGADGAVIVTSPQDVALLDSRKSVDFARKVEMRVLGIVENLSGLVCPHCGNSVDLFKRGGGEKAARELKVPFLGRIPISPLMVEASDDGTPLVQLSPDDPAAQALTQIAGQLVSAWEKTPARGEQEGQVAGEQERQVGAEPGDAAGEPAEHAGAGKLIAVAAEGEGGPDDRASGHFGRCPFYALARVREGEPIEMTAVPNRHFGEHKPGMVPRFIKELGADVIIAGGMGPMAIDLFTQFGIEVVTGASGRIKDVLDAYLSGNLTGTAPCGHGH